MLVRSGWGFGQQARADKGFWLPKWVLKIIIVA
jgi:hypothetical protein